MNDKNRITERWSEYFDELFKNQNEIETVETESIREEDIDTVESVSYEGVHDGRKHLKNNRSKVRQKLTNMRNEKLCKSGYTDYYNIFGKEEEVPMAWNEALNCPRFRNIFFH